ncbi:MAG TPA: hypothetical protein VH298_15090 [Jatrophihabitans sp.]|nr:hypothetical protein [Jatrophihabitans sp.]
MFEQAELERLDPAGLGWAARLPADDPGADQPRADQSGADQLRADQSGADLPSFDRVVVIIASSRSGSSYLFDLLRRTGAFLSLPGEHTPLYRRYRVPALGSDANDARFRHALRSTVTTGLPVTDAGPDRRADQIVRTLRMQWGFPLSGAERLAEAALPRTASDPLIDLCLVLGALRRAGVPINPWYYDLPPALVRRWFPGLPRPSGPPSRLALLESSPLLVPRLERPAVGAELGRPLLLKATADAYRVSSLLRIFADAELEFVQLTRNPAASINGLIDGWLSPAFFSHRLPGRPLRIPGYSTEQPWTQTWWNFDLPPHWPDLVASPLAQVCRDQWRAAQSAIRQSLQAHRLRPMRVRVEQLWDHRTADGQLHRILEQLRLRARCWPRSRVVMATSQPVPARWRHRQHRILPLLTDSETAELARWCGYPLDGMGNWT